MTLKELIEAGREKNMTLKELIEEYGRLHYNKGYCAALSNIDTNRSHPNGLLADPHEVNMEIGRIAEKILARRLEDTE